MDIPAVLIAGAGPVGLTLAMELARRGIAVTLVEPRARGEPPSVKCNHVAARSMEIFRRAGVVRALRNAGLPADYPNDVSYRTTTVGQELTRIRIPCRRDRYTDTSGPDGWWPTPEPPHRINQIYLEPILFDHTASLPGVTVLNRCALESLDQQADGVTAQVRDLDSGSLRTLRAQYLVGCDGGRSTVRRAIGATLVGDAVIQRVQSTYIRAADLIGRLRAPPAWAMFSLNPRRSGNVYAIDGRERWLVHNYLREDEADFESVDRDWGIRTILGVGPDFHYEVLSREDWYGRRLVADKFRSGRVFLCGDAAHLWVPYAGYGMNAGIADAADLGWLLAARLQGWGSDTVLEAYCRERQPITEQVSRFVMNHAHEMTRRRRAVPAGIEADDETGARLRREVGQDAYDLNVQQYCCAGLNFGYFYDDSPLIAYDDETAPPYSMGEFTASSVPGCRAPHFWLPDGRSLLDALGDGYSLLRFDPSVPVSALRAAARARGVPWAEIDVPPGPGREAYRHRLVVVRPDGHIAWRGDAAPADSLALLDRLRGAAPSGEALLSGVGRRA